jgi:hypothetical protein
MSWPGMPAYGEEPALQADAYIESLLGSRDPAYADASDSADPRVLEAAAAASTLMAGLVRFHPSFRFEERLAARLRHAALWGDAGDTGGMGVTGDVGRSGVIAFSERRDRGVSLPAQRRDRGASLPADAALADAMPTPRFGLAFPRFAPAAIIPAVDLAELGRTVEQVPVPVLVAGAIASGVSLAGAAFVAWRLARRPG